MKQPIEKIDYYWALFGVLQLFLLNQVIQVSTIIDLFRWASIDRPLTTISLVLVIGILFFIFRNCLLLAFSFDTESSEKTTYVRTVARTSVVTVGLLVTLLFLSKI